jgi:CelD/BcsL family acetyltransferase involved in cellulose biosynthesis
VLDNSTYDLVVGCALLNMVEKSQLPQSGQLQQKVDLADLGLIPGWYEKPSLGQLKSLWSSLSGGPVSTPFQTPDFLHAFSEKIVAGTCERFAVFSLCDEVTREPVMLMPLIWYRKGPFRIVSSPDLGLSDQNGPVFGKRFADVFSALKQSLVPALLQSIPDCDVLKVCKIHPTISGVANPLFEVPEASHEGHSLYLDQGALEDAVTNSKKSVYKEARAKFRKLQREGVSLEEATSAQERKLICRILLEQRRKRLDDPDCPISLEDENREKFYQYLAGLNEDKGPLTALALKKGEEIVAAVVLLADGTSANGVLVSIGDPKWHRMSPGMVLFVKSIEWARENGIQNFSLGAGLHSYKTRFGAAMQETKRLLVPMNMRGRTFVTASHAKRLSQALYDKTVAAE